VTPTNTEVDLHPPDPDPQAVVLQAVHLRTMVDLQTIFSVTTTSKEVDSVAEAHQGQAGAHHGEAEEVSEAAHPRALCVAAHPEDNSDLQE